MFFFALFETGVVGFRVAAAQVAVWWFSQTQAPKARDVARFVVLPSATLRFAGGGWAVPGGGRPDEEQC